MGISFELEVTSEVFRENMLEALRDPLQITIRVLFIPFPDQLPEKQKNRG